MDTLWRKVDWFIFPFNRYIREDAVKKLLKRVRGAIGMGLTWAAGWAVFGILIGVASRLTPGLPFWDSFFQIFDAPLPALAVPGFIGGALFSIVLGIAGRNHKFEDLSISRFAKWGAVGGVLLSVLPATMNAVGLAELGGDDALGIWQLTATIAVPLTILCAASAAGSLWLARRAAERQLPAGSLGENQLVDGNREYNTRRVTSKIAP
jgi:hypothetical protein